MKIARVLPSMAIDPSFVAGNEEREPRKPPIGVRATPTMQTSVHIKAQILSNYQTPTMQTYFTLKHK